MPDEPPEPEYTMESWWPIRKAFLRLWPGVSSEQTYMVLREASDLGTPGVQELLCEAIALGGKEAADLLMATVSATFPFPDSRSRAGTVVAMEALIRAGGDPTPALPTLVEALKDRHCRAAAVSTLRKARLAGWSLEPIREALERIDDPIGDVAAVRRLAFLSHPHPEVAIASLQRVFKKQRLGNLRTGIGLVEQLISSESRADQALGDEVLAALQDSGRDAYRSWFALVPAHRHFLAAGSVQQTRDALHSMSQFRYLPGEAEGLGEQEARVAALPTLDGLLRDIVAQLAARDARVAVAAADAVKAFVEQGASLEAVRAEVDAALGHSDVSVRSACSIALSLHLRRTGEEPELPGGAFYRRTYGRSDEPVSDAAPRTCALCGAQEVRVIYDEDDGSQFYRLYTSETHCAGCGRYFPNVFRAPG